jgi:uncharacterized cupin superfamily protein
VVFSVRPKASRKSPQATPSSSRPEKRAHQLTNLSETEPLLYLDFDTFHYPEVCFYPDTQKVGIFGENMKQVYYLKDQTKY